MLVIVLQERGKTTMIGQQVRDLVLNSPGLEIPKPEAKAPFKIKCMGKRRKQEAFIYTIPSHSPNSKYYAKGITIPEFEIAYSELKRNGSITRSWFNSKLSACAKEGGCNFTTIGGIFELLGVAKYAERGVYIATKK